MYICQICNKSFDSRFKFLGHCSGHSRKDNPRGLQRGSRRWKAKYEQSIHKCKFCNEEFDSGPKLGGHTVLCLKNPKRNKTIQKIQTNATGKSLSKETKKKLSLIRSVYLEEVGGGGFKNVKWFKITNIKGEEYVVRGTYEKQMAEWLNTKNILWVRRVYLKYTLTDNIQRTYSPDFFLPEYDLYIETKGYFPKHDKLKLATVISQNNIQLLILLRRHIETLDKLKTLEELKIASLV